MDKYSIPLNFLFKIYVYLKLGRTVVLPCTNVAPPLCEGTREFMIHLWKGYTFVSPPTTTTNGVDLDLPYSLSIVGVVDSYNLVLIGGTNISKPAGEAVICRMTFFRYQEFWKKGIISCDGIEYVDGFNIKAVVVSSEANQTVA